MFARHFCFVARGGRRSSAHAVRESPTRIASPGREEGRSASGRCASPRADDARTQRGNRTTTVDMQAPRPVASAYPQNIPRPDQSRRRTRRIFLAPKSKPQPLSQRRHPVAAAPARPARGRGGRDVEAITKPATKSERLTPPDLRA
eukprot:4770505-Pyramimonas_sp.AAC.1